jgi:inorganic pyrophosphatase
LQPTVTIRNESGSAGVEARNETAGMPKYDRLPTFNEKFIRVVIETPRGARAKFSYDAENRVFTYSHPLPAGISYPFDWGFIPSTLGEDGDPLDGLVIHEAATAPGIVMKCSLLGVLAVEQTEKRETVRNDRYILCPHKEDAEDAQIADGVPKELRDEIEQFLAASVLGTDKKLKFQKWKNHKQALKGLKKGQKAFDKEKGSD